MTEQKLKVRVISKSQTALCFHVSLKRHCKDEFHIFCGKTTNYVSDFKNWFKQNIEWPLDSFSIALWGKTEDVMPLYETLFRDGAKVSIED